MGCCSNRRKQTEAFADQKWDHINLADFKAKGCGTPFAYAYLWFMLIISVAVYAVDSFTAVNLLAFNRWSSQIEPAISFDISRWIFSICIILSFINLAFEAFRAIRIIKRGNVAESYLDPLAVRWQSIRMGSGQGWRRFLVFAELTKSKKGAEYIAIFTYFSLKAWIRVLVCSGPRQVINAFTLKSVYEAKLSVSAPDVGQSFTDFFDKIKTLADEDYQQALILSGMLFTFVIWVFSVLFLLAGILFYVFFLFHWIPRADGGLAGYCERKVNKALLQIVTKKVNKALAKKEANRMRAEVKAARKNGEKPPMVRTATLPDIGPVEDDALPEMPGLGRTETNSTLPPYSARPGAASNIELDSLDRKRPMPSRSGTMASSASYSSNAPLIGGAADMGYGDVPSPAPTLPDIDLSGIPAARVGTPNSQRGISPRPGMNHTNSGSYSSLRAPVTNSPAPINTPNNTGGFPAPNRRPTFETNGTYPANRSRTDRDGAGAWPQPRQFDAYRPDGRSSPGPSAYAGRNGPPGPVETTAQRPPYQPSRSATGPVPPRGAPYPPQRNATAPMPPYASQNDYFGGPGTPRGQSPAPLRRPAPPQDYPRAGTPQGGPVRNGYGRDLEAQRDPYQY